MNTATRKRISPRGAADHCLDEETGMTVSRQFVDRVRHEGRVHRLVRMRSEILTFTMSVRRSITVIGEEGNGEM